MRQALAALCRGTTDAPLENREALARLLNRRAARSQRINEPDRALCPLHDGHDLTSPLIAPNPNWKAGSGSVRARTSKRVRRAAFVVCDGTTVVGYYALAAGSVLHAQAPGNIRRNMPTRSLGDAPPGHPYRLPGSWPGC